MTVKAAAILCSAVRISDDMKKAEMCGETPYTSQAKLFPLFFGKK